jgi:hypothetical protein
MAKNDPCCNIDVVPLIICNYFSVAAKNPPKTLCKNSPKNPQKSGAKIFCMDKNFCKALTKY